VQEISWITEAKAGESPVSSKAFEKLGYKLPVQPLSQDGFITLLQKNIFVIYTTLLIQVPYLLWARSSDLN
jgi:hypothetical protein